MSSCEQLRIGDLVRIRNSQGHEYVEWVNTGQAINQILLTDHFEINVFDLKVLEDLGIHDDTFYVAQIWRLNGYQDFELIYGEEVECLLANDKEWQEANGHLDYLEEESNQRVARIMQMEKENEQLKEVIAKLEIKLLEKGLI